MFVSASNFNMRVSTDWLKNYAVLPAISADELARAVTMSVVEVEDVIDQTRLLDGVVVGKVVDVVAHPQADRLLVCRVDIGSDTLQIICGGTNVVKGMLVAVATVGSRVKWHGEGERITLEKVKIRGVESNGMIAASSELELERLFPQSSEREILDLTPFKLKVGAPLAAALGLRDVILNIDNKSMNHRPDLWGHYGMARELAALFSGKFKAIKTKPIPYPASATRRLSLKVRDDACIRYSAVVIDGVAVHESPWWLRRDLEAVGVAAINSIVDITNYVMLALGQPLHAFDYESLSGGPIVVQRTGKPASFEALNGKSYDLTPDALTIQDSRGNHLALAGIVGSKASGITSGTTTILLEAANFDGAQIRTTSGILGLRTEASARFEKRLDPALVPVATALAVEMILKMHPGSFVASAPQEHNTVVAEERVIELPQRVLDSRIGIAIDMKEAAAILKRLNCDVRAKRQSLFVGIPSHRLRDLKEAEDLIEEVARFYGYDRITPRLPRVPMTAPERNDTSFLEREVRSVISRGLAYHEVYRYSFADPEWTAILGVTEGRVALKNTLTPDQAFLRTSLLPQLVGGALENARFESSVSLFEIGRVFHKGVGEFATDATGTEHLPRQSQWCAGVRMSKEASAEQLFRESKGLLEHIFSYFDIAVTAREASLPSYAAWYEFYVQEQPIGQCGVLRRADIEPRARGYQAAVWQFSWDLFVKFANQKKAFQAFSRYPVVVRDMAVVVDAAVTWGALYEKFHHTSPLLQAVELFDIYVSPKLGTNKKSFAFRLRFESAERTLTAAEVDTVIEKIKKSLTAEFSAHIR